MSERDHTACPPTCLWCAMQGALKARPQLDLDGSQETCTLASDEQFKDDLSALVNMAGDMLASIPGDEDLNAVVLQFQFHLMQRIASSRAKNLAAETFQAMRERANAGGGDDA